MHQRIDPRIESPASAIFDPTPFLRNPRMAAGTNITSRPTGMVRGAICLIEDMIKSTGARLAAIPMTHPKARCRVSSM